MRYKVKTNRVAGQRAFAIFFLFALAIVVSKISEKVKAEPHTGLSLSKKKEIPPPRDNKRKVVPPSKTKPKKSLGPYTQQQSSPREKVFARRKGALFFFNSSGIYPQKAVNASTESPPFSRFSWCSQFYLSLCVCARDSLFCCFCRRLSSRSTTTTRERDEREQEEDERRGFVDLSSS